MRLAAVAVSLLSSITLVPAALAQSQDAPAAAPLSQPAAMPAPTAPSASLAQPPSATAPAPTSPAPTPPEATPAPPEATPAPPPAPTDLGAIRLLSTLESVCIPAAHGQDPGGLAKAAGYRKSGDSYVLKQAGYQFTILPQGSNPNQCHVDILGPVDLESPAKPLVVALHNWAVLSHDWTLYRNDKNISGASEFTTRSWENSANGQSEGLVLTTIRKADGSASQRGGDTSEMIYSVTKSAS